MMKEDTVLTTASSTPPSDAEVIERAINGESNVWVQEECGRRLQSALTRISTLERELGASDAALLSFDRAPLRAIIAPEITEAIEAARRRSTT